MMLHPDEWPDPFSAHLQRMWLLPILFPTRSGREALPVGFSRPWKGTDRTAEGFSQPEQPSLATSSASTWASVNF